MSNKLETFAIRFLLYNLDDEVVESYYGIENPNDHLKLMVDLVELIETWLLENENPYQDTLEKLQQSAEKSIRFRGHRIGEWHNTDKEHLQIMICLDCGKTCSINARPLPNEIDIGGAAVAVSCED